MSKVALVVDDSMLIRYTVCRFLEQRGFGVESATNGVEALEILARVQPAVIVTDLQMPKMSGNELITAVKNNLETTGIPIIVLARRTSGLDRTTDSIKSRRERIFSSTKTSTSKPSSPKRWMSCSARPAGGTELGSRRRYVDDLCSANLLSADVLAADSQR